MLVAENGQDEAEGDEIFYDDDEDDPEDEAYEVDDDGDVDDAVEALAQDMDLADDPELVDAFATILQRKKGQKPHGKGSGSKGQSHSFPFKAKGEVTVDQRTRAIKFLKSVTPCTSCGLKGHRQRIRMTTATAQVISAMHWFPRARGELNPQGVAHLLQVVVVADGGQDVELLPVV